MNTYLMIAELKPEHVDQYREMHLTCHKTQFSDQLTAIRSCGCKQMMTFVWKNYSLLYAECECTIEEFFEVLEKTDANIKWSAVTAPWFNPENGVTFLPPIEKVFDLEQQLNGELKPF